MDSFQPSGDEIERALLDLGPLLGVSIKEEAPDEALADPLVDPAARSSLPTNVSLYFFPETPKKTSAICLADACKHFLYERLILIIYSDLGLFCYTICKAYTTRLPCTLC